MDGGDSICAVGGGEELAQGRTAFGDVLGLSQGHKLVSFRFFRAITTSNHAQCAPSFNCPLDAKFEGFDPSRLVNGAGRF